MIVIRVRDRDFNLNQIIEFAVNWASNPISLNMKPINFTPPSIETSPSLELEALPTHLKYVYLDKQETLPIIIASHLTDGQEENLMTIFRKHKEAIGWTMTDIKGLSLAIVQHHIHLNEEAIPKRDPSIG